MNKTLTTTEKLEHLFSTLKRHLQLKGISAREFDESSYGESYAAEYDFLYLQLMSNRGYPLTEKENSKYLDLFKNAKYVRLVDLWKI